MGLVDRFLERLLDRPAFGERVRAVARQECAARHLPPPRHDTHWLVPIRTTVGVVHEVARIHETAEIWGFMDLSAMRPGDKIIIRIKCLSDEKYILAEEWVIEGYQALPLYTVPFRPVPGGTILEVLQTNGVSLDVRVDLYARAV